MDSSGMIKMAGGSSNGQQPQHNGRQDGGAIMMGDETAAAQGDCRKCRSGAMGVWYLRLVVFFR
jgi:hypothetical protein